ncbi:MAG: hypothetical protein ACJ762_05965 [Solirubrobacteraceae bacterium]
MVPRSLRLLLLPCLLAVALPASASAGTATHRIGPILIGGYGAEYKTTFHLPHPATNFSLTYMHARVVDAAGREVPQQHVMLHHLAFVNDGRADGDKSQYYCGNGFKERFYGTGEENQSLLLPPGYGYRVRAADRWHASWMLMNHHHHPRKVFIEYTLRYDKGWADTPVTPYWLGVQPCLRDPIFQVPGSGIAGSTFEKDVTWTPPVDGRIVAIGTHVHGGAQAMRITDPACGDRTIAESLPEYGLEDDPIYGVLPQIHEPSPRFASYPMSATGIPVQKGHTYRVRALYDNELPHARVMGIMHAYVAPATSKVPDCAPLPTDVQTIHRDAPYRTEIPKVDIPLAVRGPDGRARAVDTLPGAWFHPQGDAVVTLRDLQPNHRKVMLRRGATITWRFDDPVLHDVTSASGPTAVGSQPLKNGATWKLKFTRPGTYNLYCTLHPLDMQQVVEVAP